MLLPLTPAPGLAQLTDLPHFKHTRTPSHHVSELFSSNDTRSPTTSTATSRGRSFLLSSLRLGSRLLGGGSQADGKVG